MQTKPKRRFNTFFIIILLVPFIMGMLCFASCGISVYRFAKAKKCTAMTTGIVTDLKTNARARSTQSPTGSKHRRIKVYRYPVFEYEVDGVTYSLTSKEYSDTINTDDIVQIYYEPDNPENAFITGLEAANIQYAVIAVILGIFFMGVDVWLIRL